MAGRLLRVNRKLCEMLGHAESDLVGRALSEFAHPENDAEGAERRYLRRDGSPIWVETAGSLVRDAAGEASYEICVLDDVTERKQVRARQAAHGRYQEAIARFGESALWRRDAAELIAEAIETARRALGVRSVAYVQGALRSLQVEGDELSPEGNAFLGTLASLLSTGLLRIDSERKLSFLAQFDPLTGLANRAMLAERLSQALEAAKARGAPLAVLCVDLDDFSLVNETLGHAGGDALLKESAMRLLGAVRNGDTVARVSGDQFAVVLGDVTRPGDAALVAQKVLDRLSQPFVLRGKEIFATASVGIAAFPGDGEEAEALVSAAASAMHRAKQSGRNGFHFFSSETTRHTRMRAQLALELRRALERDEFRLVYQAKVDLRSRLACGAEALLRWEHPERGLMSPAQFVPVLEETGLIVPVGEWVIGRACEDIKAWLAGGRRPVPVAVNLSARQFRQQHLDRRIRSQLESAGVDPALIEIEITESQLMDDPDHAARVMNALRASGIRAAIDDFGTGYSSLAYLTRLPLAALKIDRSFVAHALTDAADAAIVRTIIDMAHTLNFTVVAEGVETDAQMAFLRRFGCEQGQGYLFSRPMSAKDFTLLT
jgi:diguanylate cyclase (GGDEF)-like protein